MKKINGSKSKQGEEDSSESATEKLAKTTEIVIDLEMLSIGYKTPSRASLVEDWMKTITNSKMESGLDDAIGRGDVRLYLAERLLSSSKVMMIEVISKLKEIMWLIYMWMGHRLELREDSAHLKIETMTAQAAALELADKFVDTNLMKIANQISYLQTRHHEMVLEEMVAH